MKRALIALLFAGCAAPGSGVHEMTATGHEAAAVKAGGAGAAAQHKASAEVLRKQEEEACAGLSTAERESSPLAKGSVTGARQLMWWAGDVGPYTLGGSVIMRGDPSISHGQLQRLLTCHIAHSQISDQPSAAAGDDPLAVPGVSASARAFGPGWAIDIVSDNPGSPEAAEVWRRASRLASNR